MALYLGSNKQKFSLGDVSFCLNFSPSTFIINGILKSFDDYILKDKNGLYLTVKESE